MNALDWLVCLALVVLFGWLGSVLLAIGLELFRGAGRGNHNRNSNGAGRRRRHN